MLNSTLIETFVPICIGIYIQEYFKILVKKIELRDFLLGPALKYCHSILQGGSSPSFSASNPASCQSALPPEHQKTAHVHGFLPPVWEAQMVLPAPGLGMIQPWSLQPFEESVNQMFLSLPVTQPFK